MYFRSKETRGAYANKFSPGRTAARSSSFSLFPSLRLLHLSFRSLAPVFSLLVPTVPVPSSILLTLSSSWVKSVAGTLISLVTLYPRFLLGGPTRFRDINKRILPRDGATRRLAIISSPEKRIRDNGPNSAMQSCCCRCRCYYCRDSPSLLSLSLFSYFSSQRAVGAARTFPDLIWHSLADAAMKYGEFATWKWRGLTEGIKYFGRTPRLGGSLAFGGRGEKGV